MKKFLLVFLLSLYFSSIFAANNNNEQNIQSAKNVWSSVSNAWDAAIRANSNTNLLTQSLNTISSKLVISTLWSGNVFDPKLLIGKTAVLNFIRNTEAPLYSNSVRNTTSISGSTLGNARVTLSILAQHRLTRASDNFVVSQVERITITFLRLGGDWLISSLQLTIIEDDRDELIAEILALRAQNEELQLIADEYETEQTLYATHKAVIEELYLDVTYPLAANIIQSGVPPHFFSRNVKGRIHPVGNFEHLEDVVEYFYALSPLPSTGATITNATVVHFTNNGLIAASEVHFTFTSTDGAYEPAKLIQKGFWRFDTNNTVIEFDLEILNLGAWSKARLNNYDNPFVQAGTIQSVCQTTQAVCVGANQQYASMAACVDYLTNQTPFGTPDKYWSNSVSCRTVHLMLAAIRPDTHCTHVGPSGGGKCVDSPYNSIFTKQFFPEDPNRLIN